MIGPGTGEVTEGSLAFVLGAGAAQGAVQVGQLQAVREAGIGPDLLLGSSVGALNAAVIAHDPHTGLDRLNQIWRALRPRDLVRRTPGRAILPLDPAGMRAVIEQAVPAEATFADLAVPLAVVAAEPRTGRRHLLRHGALVPALMAACAIPWILPAVHIDGVPYVDGGARADLPIAEAFTFGADTVLAFPTTRWPRCVGHHGYRASAPLDDARILVLDGARPPGGGWTLTKTANVIAHGRQAVTRQLRRHQSWARVLAADRFTSGLLPTLGPGYRP